MSLVQMFLVTYQSFASPELLFSKLLERFNVPDRIQSSDAVVIRMKVGNVLRKWIENCFDDFSPELVSRLNLFIKEIQYDENKTIASLSKSICNAIGKAENKNSDSKIKQFNKTTPAPKVCFSHFQQSKKEEILYFFVIFQTKFTFFGNAFFEFFFECRFFVNFLFSCCFRLI